MDYSKLKTLLRDDGSDEEDGAWTEADENRFCDETFNVQLEKVAKFQEDTVNKLRERADSLFEKLKEITPARDDDSKGKERSEITTQRLEEVEKELDEITNKVRELKKYSNLNYTGFLKIVKKHDRKRGNRYRIRPMMQVSLARRPFNSEKGYTPLLNKLSIMYEAIHQYLNHEDTHMVDLDSQPEAHNGETYMAYKCQSRPLIIVPLLSPRPSFAADSSFLPAVWVHPDNLLEVKTMILRRLPALVYSESSAKEADAAADPTLTSLYFENSKFELYTAKVERAAEAASLRLRWYGQLSSKPDIFLEQKIVQDTGTSEERKIIIKDKYVQPFLDGEYRMEKSIQKMERQNESPEEIETFVSTVDTIQEFVQTKQLQPLLRANYVRTAFQKPADDRVRISIDTDLAFIREDVLDERRPCRDPTEWHRRDIDNRNMTYPFSDISPSDISRFPFAVLEIKLKEDTGRRRPAWIEDLMASHLVHPAPRFSKFVHGVATLFDDYVNRLPFWLSDLETDIRRDPQAAFEEEEERKAQRAENELVVGSLLGTKTSSFKPSKSSPVAKSYLAERAAAEAARSGASPMSRSRRGGGGGGEGEGEDEVDDEDETPAESAARTNYGTLSSVLPSLSLTRYARWRRAHDKPLPEGVVEPAEWIKNAGPLQIEPKVWLANERTFLKWQHICVLLGTLAVALYTAGGKNHIARFMGLAYIAIAVLAGLWGRYMLHTRREMIVGRSGKDFDNMLGPMVVSVALMVSLILNFVFSVSHDDLFCV